MGFACLASQLYFSPERTKKVEENRKMLRHVLGFRSVRWNVGRANELLITAYSPREV